MEFKHDFSDEFNRELAEVLSVIMYKFYSPVAARRLSERVDKTVTMITEQPYMYRLYHDDDLARMGYRAAAVDNFLIFYRVDEAGKTVHILRFVYGKRNMTGVI